MTKIAATDRHKVADLYVSGMTQAAVAAEFGITTGRVGQILRALGVRMRTGGNKSERAPWAPNDRHIAIAEMYKAGATLREVGSKFGITSERARQLLRKLEVDVLEGGRAIRIFKNTSSKVAGLRTKNERQEARIRATWGMSLDGYRAHVAEHGSSSIGSSPMGKYRQHKNNALKRGIAWNFTFADWWRVWQESGKWEQRGRVTGGTLGYVMARYGDGDTPYSPETVYICTQSQNSKDSYIVSPASVRFANNPNKLGAGRGWSICKRNKRNPYVAQFGRKNLGSFPTPELARAAYLAAVERSKS